ncbi:hypothetical protein ACH5RR_001162 [Cinchona calisaya]|uniref:Uncharacterized protein n=1 Tax=Cinchona calisaya TaxID=153742 RepID=A0ABD3B2W7_9GENT
MHKAAISPFHNVREVAHKSKCECPFKVSYALFDRERDGQLPSVLVPAAVPLEPVGSESVVVISESLVTDPRRIPATLAISTKASSHLPTIPNIKLFYNNSRQQESKKRIEIALGASQERKIERLADERRARAEHACSTPFPSFPSSKRLGRTFYV